MSGSALDLPFSFLSFIRSCVAPGFHMVLGFQKNFTFESLKFAFGRIMPSLNLIGRRFRIPDKLSINKFKKFYKANFIKLEERSQALCQSLGAYQRASLYNPYKSLIWAHAPTEDREDEAKDNFNEQFEQAFFPMI
uniref:Uncharacterized protein n=1 Tax=Megaselia scalaris TaxID=36166 RepID=T1GEB2_MEGSC